MRAVRKSEDPLLNKDVIAALAKKDHIIDEFGSKLESIVGKIEKAQAILTKHKIFQ